MNISNIHSPYRQQSLIKNQKINKSTTLVKKQLSVNNRLKNMKQKAKESSKQLPRTEKTLTD